jgi:N-carbamoyl-L-amino-acid hydrolase
VYPTSLEGFLGSTDRDGTTFAQALGRLDALFGDVPLRPLAVPFHAFVEAHIEQGPVLEQLAVPLGVVQGIQGCRWFEVRTKGRAAHSGTTPLANKRDALMAAVTVIDRLYEMLGRGDDRLRLTVGRIVVEPNSPNVVPVSTFFTVDLRHPDESVLEEVGAAILALAGTAAGCPVTVERTMVMSPTVFDPTVVAAVDRAAAAFAPNRVALHSGAFHDSLRLNVHCPTGMIFVPSIDGISHSPAERTELAHMTLGARALAHAVVELADA